MNIRLRWWRLALLLAASSQSLTAGVSVEFDDISRFRDFTINGIFNQESARDLFDRSLQMLWNDTLHQFLPEGTSLKLTFHDIDMAGEMQPVPRFGQAYTRVVSDAFPPMLDFSYKILGADGTVLAAGKESLLGKDYQFRFRGTAPVGRSTFYYEFEMLKSWLKGVSQAALSAN